MAAAASLPPRTRVTTTQMGLRTPSRWIGRGSRARPSTSTKLQRQQSPRFKEAWTWRPPRKTQTRATMYPPSKWLIIRITAEHSRVKSNISKLCCLRLRRLQDLLMRLSLTRIARYPIAKQEWQHPNRTTWPHLNKELALKLKLKEVTRQFTWNRRQLDIHTLRQSQSLSRLTGPKPCPSSRWTSIVPLALALAPATGKNLDKLGIGAWQPELAVSHL